MTATQRKVGWELVVAGTPKKIGVDYPVQTEQLLGWQTNVMQVEVNDDEFLQPGANVVLRYVDYDDAVRSTQYSGEIDSIASERSPQKVAIRCVGPMIRLNRVRKGGRLNLTGMTDGEAVEAILKDCGVRYDHSAIADAGYVLGDRAPVFWPRGTSGADMIAQLDEVFGCVTRELPNGKIARWFYDLVPRASNIRASYVIGTTAQAYSLSRDRGGATSIQNSWEVRGLQFERALSPDCTFSPFARAQEPNERLGRTSGSSTFQSDIIQDDELARAIVRRFMRWFNREPDTIGLEVENDPNIMPGAVIGVTDSSAAIHLNNEKPYLVLTVDRTGPTMRLSCVGGAAGSIGSIEYGYEKECNETATEEENLPNDFTFDNGYSDPNCPGWGETCPDPDAPVDPGEVSEDPIFSDLAASTATGDCGPYVSMGPGVWHRIPEAYEGWECLAEDDCTELHLTSDESRLYINATTTLDENYDAVSPAPLRTSISGEVWFSTHADGEPSLRIAAPALDDESTGPQVIIRSGGNMSNELYGANMRTDFSQDLSPSEEALHPGCVNNSVTNNGTWNFYERVPTKGAWHSFSVTFWEDTTNDFVPRTTLTLDGFTEYVEDSRCSPNELSCETEHVFHKYLFVGKDEGTRTDDFNVDPPVKLRNVKINRILLDASRTLAEDNLGTCVPNPNYVPSVPGEACGTSDPFCNCTPVALGNVQLRATNTNGWYMGTVNGTTVYQATTSSAMAPLNGNAVQTSTNDYKVTAPAATLVSGSFAWDVAATGNDAYFCVSLQPWDDEQAQPAKACVYADGHTNTKELKMSASLNTETSKPPSDVPPVLGDKHPVCPWGANAATAGQWNFEDVELAIGDWHTFTIGFDERAAPQRLTLTVDDYTEYVDDLWFEDGTCNPDANHPGVLCDTVHSEGHRVNVWMGAASGTYGQNSPNGTLASTGHITPQSGGNTSGTSTEKTFNGPFDMDLLSDGRLVVTDVLNVGIKIFNDNNSWYRDSSPTWVTNTATYPRGVAVINDVIYVVLEDGKVRTYSSTGTFISTLAHNLTSGRRAAAGPDGNIYVAQSDGLNRVAVISTTGTVVRYIGSSGTNNGQFGTSGPGGIAFDADGNVYVADQTGKRINIYTSAGVYISHWGTAGSGAGQFDVPSGIAIRNNTLFVVNRHSTTPSLSKLQMFDLDGTFQQEWVGTTTGTIGPSPATTDKFGFPSSVITSGDIVFVTDGYGGIGTTGRNEVRLFNSATEQGNSPVGYVKDIAIVQAAEGTCARNIDYAPGTTNQTGSFQ